MNYKAFQRLFTNRHTLKYVTAGAATALLVGYQCNKNNFDFNGLINSKKPMDYFGLPKIHALGNTFKKSVSFGY